MFVMQVYAIIFSLFIIDKAIGQENVCLAPDGSQGFCVPIEVCPSINNILNSAPRPLPSEVVELLNNNNCGFEHNDQPKVCCKDKISSDTQTTPRTTLTSPTSKITPDSLPDGGSINHRINEPEDVSYHVNVKLLPLKCGYLLDQKISNGNKTELFQFPWMALLQYESEGRLENLCAGSLISEKYVLTAAHCVTKLRSTVKLVAVRLGEYDTSTDTDCQIISEERVCAPPVQDIPIESFEAHPMYNNPRFANDIAVVRLSKPADVTPESVRPICLPINSQVLNLKLKRVTVTGWGTTEKNAPAPVLLQAQLPIVSNEECQTKFPALKLSPRQMCAGGEIGIDSCSGDSGGPLFYPAPLNGVRMVQFGIVSIGVPTCDSVNVLPGVYVRVSFYMRWVLDQLKP